MSVNQDCYVTLEKFIPVYYDQDGILIDTKISEWVADKTKPEYKALRWKSPLASERGYKLNIGENSNTEAILVAKVVSGTTQDVNGVEVNIETLDFCLCSQEPGVISFHPFGLYKILLTFHWIHNGVERVKYFNGYLFVANKYKFKIGEGNYIRDREVTPPLLTTTPQPPLRKK